MALDVEILATELKNAYRKWKSYAYYEPFSKIDVDNLTKFENTEVFMRDEFFRDFAVDLSSDAREGLLRRISANVSVRCFPKYSPPKNPSNNDLIFSNVAREQGPLERFQYFIGLPVEAHILGALWTMKFGRVLDRTFSPHCYGNRLHHNLSKGTEEGVTPFLYYPYFKKYESWRDEAIDVVEQLMKMQLNAMMICLDIERYFYNCRVDFQKLRKFLKDTKSPEEDLQGYEFLTDFVEEIFSEYSRQFTFDDNPEKEWMIPIGFLPSGVISNWYLSQFDQEVKEKINPQYYGRYVDDIILVLSFNNNQLDDTSSKKTKNEIWKLLKPVIRHYRNDKFTIAGRYLWDSSHELSLSAEKVKLFYFSHSNSAKLLETFKQNIAKNSSAFLYLHETDEDVLNNLSSEIWEIEYSSSRQKLRSIKEMKLDNFQLSKWLAFLNNYSGDLNSDQLKQASDILFETLSGAGYLSNFALWEKYLFFFFKHRMYPDLLRFCQGIQNAIDNVKVIDNYGSTTGAKCHLKASVEEDIDEKITTKTSLRNYFVSVLQRVLCLRGFGQDAINLGEVYKYLRKNNIPLRGDFRSAYLKSYMFNSQVTPFPLIDHSKQGDYDSVSSEYDYLSSEIKKPSDQKPDNCNHLRLFPRFVHFDEIQMFLSSFPFFNLQGEEKSQEYKKVWLEFWQVNYGKEPVLESPIEFVQESPKETTENGQTYVVRSPWIYKLNIGVKKPVGSIRIGIANVNVKPAIFEENLLGNSLFSRSTRNGANDIINLAAKKQVDLLVLPECYIHYSWVTKMIRIAREHQMAIVFGMEHVVDREQKIAYNYLISILPFEHEGYKDCLIEMRIKNHPSPSEKLQIEGHFLKVPEHKPVIYARYNWKGLCFAPYSCYEIASITDRAIFKSKVDAIIAVEWNKDTDYYSSIIESLARDIHCYCIQVNSSEYGDNRITQPAHSYNRDKVLAKGGENDYLIVSTINIAELRIFQLKDYPLQKEQEEKLKYFKPTPPDFDHEEVLKR